jgi:hypothetical protein
MSRALRHMAHARYDGIDPGLHRNPVPADYVSKLKAAYLDGEHEVWDAGPVTAAVCSLAGKRPWSAAECASQRGACHE